VSDQVSESGTIQWQDDGKVVVATIDRSARKNALTFGVAEALATNIEAMTEPRPIVITGSGDTFCAGIDLAMSRAEMEQFRGYNERLLESIAHHPGPVLAAINGPVIGAGVMLALSCDLRVADGRTRFSMPQTRLGLKVDARRVRFLVAHVGVSMATDMLLGCTDIDGATALQGRLVHRLTDDALTGAVQWATTMAAWSTEAFASHKSLLRLAITERSAPGGTP
jgi:enoyl-CoA hydratase